MDVSGQYTLYHLHSDLSNAVTNIDSTTKYYEYIARAKECGMKAMAFSEHGSVFEWWHKKSAIEAAGMKYIHAVEAYLTADLSEKIRDNYHCVLIAKNYDGFLELNALISKSFNRNDNHFYYVPRVSFQELFGKLNLSDKQKVRWHKKCLCLVEFEDVEEIAPLAFDHQGNMDDWLIIEKIEDVVVGTSIPYNYEKSRL